MAEQKGYFDKMCLDVDLKSSFSTANYPLVAAGPGPFSSGGFVSEVLTQSTGGANFAVVVNEGKQGIDALLVKTDAGVTTLADVKGKTIGVLGAITPSVKAMLFKAGLVEGAARAGFVLLRLVVRALDQAGFEQHGLHRRGDGAEHADGLALQVGRGGDAGVGFTHEGVDAGLAVVDDDRELGAALGLVEDLAVVPAGGTGPGPPPPAGSWPSRSWT